MHLFFLLACVFCSFIYVSEGYVPLFFNGRPKGGFLGQPGNKHRQGLSAPPTPPEKWFKQKLNHFNGADTRTWQQRYFVNNAFYKPGGPIFVQIGGEGPANPIWMTEGAWVNYAQTYNALLLMLEHRYYGKSHPTSDLSVENLQYLSSEQALADLAAFITDAKKEVGNNPKVITFGGSYPGSLSAWFRLKYPHLVDGAVASSAPLLAKVDFYEYLEVVDSALKTFPPAGVCTDPIKMATEDLTQQLKTPEGRTQLKEMFKLCDDIDPNVPKDITNLYASLANNFEGVVQYNKDNRAFEGAAGANITIDTLCNIMSNGHVDTPLGRYAKINSLILQTYKQECLDFKYDKMINDLKRTNWSSPAAEGSRQWTYQTCTEFAFYQSSDSKKQPFGQYFDINFSLQQCADIYGPQFNNATIYQAVERSNEDYGALGIKITKVLFPNGSIDPWHALGVLKDLGPDARAIFINGTAHCANMYPDSPDDLPALKQAREEIRDTIGQWLKS